MSTQQEVRVVVDPRGLRFWIDGNRFCAGMSLHDASMVASCPAGQVEIMTYKSGSRSIFLPGASVSFNPTTEELAQIVALIESAKAPQAVAA